MSGSKTTNESLPTTNKQWLSMAGNGNKQHIVLVSGDEEYRSEEALPQLAKILAERHGFNCTVLFAQDPEEPGIIDPNYVHNIPGLEHLNSADLMIIFTRFRALPDEQMQYIDNFLKQGKPVVGIRTSTHAFRFEGLDFKSEYKHYGNFYKGNDVWQDGFGRLVLGEKWISHHGRHGHQSTRGIASSGAANHPILNGIVDGDIWGPSDVYGIRLPQSGDAFPILIGQVVERENEYDENDALLGMRPTDQKLPGKIKKENDKNEEIEVDQNNPMMPIAWTKSYQLPGGEKGIAFNSTIGASTDLLSEGTRRMLVNAVYWCLDISVPEKAEVGLVGTYEPGRFKFYKDEYWDNLNLSISSLE
ncbi:MAG: hypothetical protein KAQ62_01940 [Cyclobacteriaceae bacterium]|nr:hypothetical protein [Cyclobacteriaceae bacterium]